jgi:tartrate/fumarate subfamily iron-sulfur-dependent hydro-lyase beta chain
MKKHELSGPLLDENLKALEPGDFFTFTGKVFTCRPLAYDRLLNSAEGHNVARQLRELGVQVLFHCGPLVQKQREVWKILGMVPMPSWLAGTERISRAVSLLGLRIVIGKGTLDSSSTVLTDCGCVHAVCVGNFNDYGLKVKTVIEGHWLDLGLPEALWIFEAEQFGPFIVETDVRGNSLYKKEDETFEARAGSILDELGIKLDSYKTSR